METIFNEYKEGMKTEESLFQFAPDYYEKELKLLKLGILVNQDAFIIINPLIKKCNTLNSAKIRLKKLVVRWITNLDREADKQEDFIIDMVAYYKYREPIELNTIGTRLTADLSGVEHKYANGKGKAFVREGKLICFFYGHSAINSPSGCDIFNAHTELNLLILE